MRAEARVWVAAGAALLAQTGAAPAGVLEFSDRDEWFAAVDQVTTIDFTDFPHGTLLSNQYDELGVLFTDRVDIVLCCGGAFPNDGAGVNGVGSISLAFTAPQYAIAVDFPGDVMFDLYNGGELFYTSSQFGGGGIGNFGGLISTQPFDAAVISDPVDDHVFIDDLHFGVPGAGAPWLFGAAAFFPRRRRRTGGGSRSAAVTLHAGLAADHESRSSI